MTDLLVSDEAIFSEKLQYCSRGRRYSVPFVQRGMGSGIPTNYTIKNTGNGASLKINI